MVARLQFGALVGPVLRRAAAGRRHRCRRGAEGAGRSRKAGLGVYPTLARFREAALLAKDGKTADAVAAYDAIATAETNTHIRALALVLAGLLLVDGGDVAQVEQRVGGLVDGTTRCATRPARRSAWSSTRPAISRAPMPSFERRAGRSAGSQELRQRVQIYMAQLVAQGVLIRAAPVPRPPRPLPPQRRQPLMPTRWRQLLTHAAPAVGDAPAMETGACRRELRQRPRRPTKAVDVLVRPRQAREPFPFGDRTVLAILAAADMPR